MGRPGDTALLPVLFPAAVGDLPFPRGQAGPSCGNSGSLLSDLFCSPLSQTCQESEEDPVFGTSNPSGEACCEGEEAEGSRLDTHSLSLGAGLGPASLIAGFQEQARCWGRSPGGGACPLSFLRLHRSPFQRAAVVAALRFAPGSLTSAWHPAVSGFSASDFLISKLGPNIPTEGW